MRGSILVAVLFWAQLFGASTTFASCSVPYIGTLANQTVPGRMYVTSGERCKIQLSRTRGPIFTTRIVANAKIGHVSVSGNVVRYASKAGYVGEDRFTFVREGLDTQNTPGVRTVEMTVYVSAK